jgi:methylmalonyl-CoA/ethylmalonyl-CoA epimerase
VNGLPEVSNVKTTFTYVGIRVKNLQESIDFYTNLLGMTLVMKPRAIPETQGEVAIVQSDDATFFLELNHYGTASPYNTDYVVGEGLDHLAFKVDDIDAALREAEQRGYPLKLDVTTDRGRWAYIEDPNGIWIELIAE